MFILLIIQRKNIWKKFKIFSLSYILEDIKTQIHYSNNNAPEIDTTNKNELEQNINVTVTLGTAFNKEKQSFEDLIKLADKRLYFGKENGKNQLVSKTI